MENSTTINAADVVQGTISTSGNQPTTVTISTPAPEPQKTPTVDELKAQLVALEAEKDKLKKAMDAACSDAAKQKKEAAKWQEQFKATLDEQKRKEFEVEETIRMLKAENEEHKAKERVATYKNKLMNAGYDDSTASTMATALPEGVDDSFFEAHKMFLERTKQAVKTQALNSQPGLSVGTPPSTSADARSAEDENIRRWFGLK